MKKNKPGYRFTRMTVEHAERIKRFADSQNPKVSIQAALNYAVELGINSPEFTKARN